LLNREQANLSDNLNKSHCFIQRYTFADTKYSNASLQSLFPHVSLQFFGGSKLSRLMFNHGWCLLLNLSFWFAVRILRLPGRSLHLDLFCIRLRSLVSIRLATSFLFQRLFVEPLPCRLRLSLPSLFIQLSSSGSITRNI
jgi:hypothetical protein